MRTCLVVLLSAAAAIPAAAHHGSHSGSTSGGQRTMSPAGPAAGKIYLGLRIDHANYEHIDAEDLMEAAEEGRALHGLESATSYYLEGDFGVAEWLALGVSAPYREIDGFREAHHHHEEEEEEGAEAIEDVDPDGIGDLLVWAHFTILRGDLTLGVRVGIEAPTGETDERGADGEKLEADHQPGSGSWDFLGGVAVGYETGRLAVHGAFSAQVNTRGSRKYEIGDTLDLSVGAGVRLTPDGMDVKLFATADAWIEWHGRDTDHGHGIAESSGFVYYASPGVRLEVGPFVAQAAVPFQLENDVEDEPDEDWRLIVGAGLKF